jgi:hypothetical protein
MDCELADADEDTSVVDEAAGESMEVLAVTRSLPSSECIGLGVFEDLATIARNENFHSSMDPGSAKCYGGWRRFFTTGRCIFAVPPNCRSE